MDSGNSSSLQSSSGADEEHDSSTNIPDSLVIPQGNFLLNPTGGNLTDSLSSSSKPLHQSSPLLSCPTSYNQPSSSPFRAFSQPDFNPSSLLNIDSYSLTRPYLRNTTLDVFSKPSAMESRVGYTSTLSKDHGPAKNPKKRTRASRRAPTTVLTTDTTNFRAMVQEFTGIPTPPFPSSSFGRSRLDSVGSSFMKPSTRHLDPRNFISGSLLRPTAQKFIPPLNVGTIMPTSNNSSAFAINPSTSIGYHMGSSLDHFLGSQQPELMLNMQHQLGLDTLPLNNPLLSSVPRPPLSSQLPSLNRELPIWKDTIESLQHNLNERGDDRMLLVDGGNKFNHFTGPPSNRFHRDESLENAGEGTFDSWTCPID